MLFTNFTSSTKNLFFKSVHACARNFYHVILIKGVNKKFVCTDPIAVTLNRGPRG